MTNKQTILRTDENSPEYKWLQAQQNKTESLKSLIQLAIANFGYTDLTSALVLEALKTSKLIPTNSQQDITNISARPKTINKEQITAKPKTQKKNKNTRNILDNPGLS